jgi:hypothetical protein
MSRLARRSNSRGTDGRLLSATERIQLVLTVLERTYRGEPWLVAEGIIALADRYLLTGEREELRRVISRAQRIARTGNLPTQLAQADCVSAYTLAYDEQLDSARALLAEAKAALSAWIRNTLAFAGLSTQVPGDLEHELIQSCRYH